MDWSVVLLRVWDVIILNTCLKIFLGFFISFTQEQEWYLNNRPVWLPFTSIVINYLLPAAQHDSAR